MRSSWKVWDQLAHLMCCGDHLYPPPPVFTCLICGESYINRVQENNSSVHSVTFTLFCDTLLLTTSSPSSSSSSTSPPFSFLPLPLLTYWLQFTDQVPWLPSCCLTLPQVSLAASHKVQPNTLPSREPSDLSGLKPDGPPWVSLVFSTFSHLFWDPASRLTVLTTRSEWTWSKQSFECLFRTVDVYYLLWICCTFCIPTHFLYSISIQFKYFLFGNLQFSSNCPIIVWLYYLLLDYSSVFWSWKCIPGISIPLSTTIYPINEHHTHTRLAYFCLSIGFSKAYCHHRR